MPTRDPAMEMEIARDGLLLHRLINDALNSGGPGLVPLGPNSRRALIEATIERIQNKRWAGLVREDDYPINIEGVHLRLTRLLAD